MIIFKRPLATLRAVLMQLNADGFAIQVLDDGRVATEATRGKLNEYIARELFPPEILETVNE